MLIIAHRSKGHYRRWANHRDGSAGPAGPCRRLAPDGTVLGVIVALEAVPLAVASPLIGAPMAENLTPETARQRLCRARKDAGAVVLPTGTVLDGDLVDGLIALHWFGEWDRDNPEAVAAKLIAGLRQAVGLDEEG